MGHRSAILLTSSWMFLYHPSSLGNLPPAKPPSLPYHLKPSFDQVSARGSAIRISLALAFAFFTNHAWATWTKVFEIDRTAYYLDAASITISEDGNLRQAWELHVIQPVRKTRVFSRSTYMRGLTQFDCKQMRYRLLTLLPNKGLAEMEEIPEVEVRTPDLWKDVTVANGRERMLAIVCDR